jgi:hypothetical protein
VHHAEHVGAHQRVERLVGDVGERPVGADPGVRHHEIDAPEAVDDRVDGRADGDGIAHVAPQRQPAGQGRDGVEVDGRAGQQRNAGAARRRGQRDRPTEPARGTGDDDHVITPDGPLRCSTLRVLKSCHADGARLDSVAAPAHVGVRSTSMGNQWCRGRRDSASTVT